MVRLVDAVALAACLLALLWFATTPLYRVVQVDLPVTVQDHVTIKATR